VDSLFLRDSITISLMTASPTIIEQGKSWYWKAHDYAASLAATYEMSLHQVAGIIASLSPGCKWSKNQRDAETVCYAAYYGKDMPTGINTYRPQLRKAWAIAHTVANAYAYERMLGGDSSSPKTRAFYWNIVSPGLSGDVTIDRWVCRKIVGKDDVTFKQYGELAQAFRDVAGVFGYRPHEAQAIVWLQAKGE